MMVRKEAPGKTVLKMTYVLLKRDDVSHCCHCCEVYSHELWETVIENV